MGRRPEGRLLAHELETRVPRSTRMPTFICQFALRVALGCDSVLLASAVYPASIPLVHLQSQRH